MRPLLNVILKIIATVLGTFMWLPVTFIAIILWDSEFLKFYNDVMNYIWKIDQ